MIKNLTKAKKMNFGESVAKFIFAILAIICVFGVKSCECNMRAGAGMEATYSPFLGCMFDVKDGE